MREAAQWIRTDIEAISAMILQYSFLDSSNVAAVTRLRDIVTRIDTSSVDEISSLTQYITEESTVQSILSAEEALSPISDAITTKESTLEDSLPSSLDISCDAPHLDEEIASYIIDSLEESKPLQLPAISTLQSPIVRDRSLPQTLECLHSAHERLQMCLKKLQEENRTLERKMCQWREKRAHF